MGSLRQYVPQRHSPHPPSGWIGQCCKVALFQARCATYCSRVNSIAKRSCTLHGPSRFQRLRAFSFLASLRRSSSQSCQGPITRSAWATSTRRSRALSHSDQASSAGPMRESTTGGTRARGRANTLHRTYTREEPNSFVTPEVREFMAWAKKRFPQHFAYVLVGL